MFFNKLNDGLFSHSKFKGKDLRHVLRVLHLKILEGCKNVVSQIFAIAYPAEKHHLWHLAKKLGETYSTTLDEFCNTCCFSRTRN